MRILLLLCRFCESQAEGLLGVRVLLRVGLKSPDLLLQRCNLQGLAHGVNPDAEARCLQPEPLQGLPLDRLPRHPRHRLQDAQRRAESDDADIVEERLERDGAIKLERARVAILDPKALERWSESSGSPAA